MAIKMNQVAVNYYFNFNEETKRLWWKSGSIGGPAGTKTSSGKYVVGLMMSPSQGTVKYYTDKLVVLSRTGIYPTGRVKHINGDNGDDTYENLEYNV